MPERRYAIPDSDPCGCCEVDAPTSCPDGLEDSYTVTLTWKIGDDDCGQCSQTYTFTVDKIDDCEWGSGFISDKACISCPAWATQLGVDLDGFIANEVFLELAGGEWRVQAVGQALKNSDCSIDGSGAGGSVSALAIKTTGETPVGDYEDSDCELATSVDGKKQIVNVSVS